MNGTTLRSRMIYAGVFIAALVIAMAITSFLGQRAVERSAESVTKMEAGNVLLQKLLRGLNEVIVTEGSSTSIKLTRSSLEEFNTLAGELKQRGVAIGDVLTVWGDLSQDVEKFLKLGRFGTSEDESMLAFGKLNTRADKVVEQIGKVQQALNADADALQSRVHMIEAVVVLIGLALLAIVGVVIYRGVYGAIGGEPALVAGIAERIAAGDLDTPLPAVKGTAVGIMGAMQQMHVNLKARLEADQRNANEMLRIKIALDNVSTGVMIADSQRTVIYANQAVMKLLGEAEADIRRDLPGFTANTIVGSNIDQFHKKPEHQSAMLASLASTTTANFALGGHNMRVTASPVINEKGERLGAVAEWVDRTAEVQIEHEVADIVSSASLGDLSMRLDLNGKTGFFGSLAEGLNQLLDNTEQSLKATSSVLSRVAQGDLTQTVDANFSGIFGQLKDDTNTTIERLRDVIGRIKDASDLISTASQEIAAGNSDLSSRTEEQASSLEETSSSMEELNATVKQNADNARDANKLAGTSNEVATRGGEMVKQVIHTMNGIQESSKKIADIIGVIDSIAFQTNILALNAAVEAARAGEQGRGFAVVATEVRNLAQRSATAAKEIKELIAESVDKVDTGAKLVDTAGRTMDDVVASFRQVTELVTEISNASREQSSGIEQVTQAVGQMDEVTQQNAALVEQAAAAAESLEEQARGLVQAVSMFKLDARHTAVPVVTLRATPPPRSLPAKTRTGSTRNAPPRPDVKALPAHVADEADSWAEF
jgi:methyl-accepting chemotaxis protein